MKPKKITTIQELNAFFDTYNPYSINVICQRNADDYEIRIQAYSSETNDLAMMIFKTVVASVTFNIHLDSKMLEDAYLQLTEEEKIPAVHEICNVNSAYDGEYMRLLVKASYKKLMPYLKAFNGQKDDYTSIAKITAKHRGMVFSYISGLEKEEYIF